MKRKLALPLFLLVFALCVIFASRTPQPIIEELPSDAADAPAVLLTLTEEVGGQTVTLRIYELDEVTGDGRSELVTRSTFGTGVPRVFVYRWNAAEGISQHSGIDWEKADAELAKLSAPLGSVARAETYHAEDNTVTLTLRMESGTKETTLPLTTDILGEWHAND